MLANAPNAISIMTITTIKAMIIHSSVDSPPIGLGVGEADVAAEGDGIVVPTGTNTG